MGQETGTGLLDRPLNCLSEKLPGGLRAALRRTILIPRAAACFLAATNWFAYS
jgi:hypothetical protein